MSEERIRTGIEIRHGTELDSKQLPPLFEKYLSNHIDVTEMVGDITYISVDNLTVCKEKSIFLKQQRKRSLSCNNYLVN